jgi:hypothetical protein
MLCVAALIYRFPVILPPLNYLLRPLFERAAS